MSDIHEEVLAWLCGWGPSLDRTQAHQLLAEVQEIQKNILSPSEHGKCGNFKVSLDIIMILCLRPDQMFELKLSISSTLFLLDMEPPFNVP
jgi:hypothetical protein